MAVVNNGLCRPDTSRAIGESFDEVVLPNLDAAYRVARWLIRNEHDAEDVVQEASLRAFRYFRTFTGGNGRAWFLRIVRDTSCGWRGARFQAATAPFDKKQHRSAQPASDPETLLLQTDDVTLIEQAMRFEPPSRQSADLANVTAGEPVQIRRVLDRSDPSRPRMTCRGGSSAVPETHESSVHRPTHLYPKRARRTN